MTVDTTNHLVAPPLMGAIRDYKMLIGGKWVGAVSAEPYKSLNPYTGTA
jgi:hypothetical protein